MKNILILLLFSLSIISGFSQKIEINKEGLYIDSIKITSETNLEEIEYILGSPSNIYLKHNTIWAYDNLGILIYISPKTDKIGEIRLEFINQGFKFSPLNSFTGQLFIFNMSVNKATPLASLKSIKQLKFEENVIFNYVAITSYLKLYLHELNNEHSLEYLGICF